MELPDAIEPDQLKSAAIAVIVVLAVAAFLVMRAVQKMVTKVVLLGVLAAGGMFLYSQRGDLDECQKRLRRAPDLAAAPDERCTCQFAGMDVEVPGCAALLPGDDDPE